MESQDNKPTCLHSRHVARGAQMSPFGGFDMPIQYAGIIEEHNAVRSACGVFDVSHMGEMWVKGPDALRFVSHIFTNDISVGPSGKCYYGMMLNEDGGVVDDLLVYKLCSTPPISKRTADGSRSMPRATMSGSRICATSWASLPFRGRCRKAC